MARSACVFVVAVALLSSCDPETGTDGGLPANPPQVFLTVVDANVIGDAVHGNVNVSGCKKVAGIELLQQNTRLRTIDYVQSPTEFTLEAGFFAPFYSQLGIATSLTLKAKVVCDDGRTNTSQPVGVTFFPIAQRFSTASGTQVVPDNFIAEGGLGGSANTFIGCGRTEIGGTAIVRVGKDGTEINRVAQMPFDCSLSTVISELSTVNNYRWIFEPGVGAFALHMGTFVPGNRIKNTRALRIGVGKNGTAVVWINEPGTANRIVKLLPPLNDNNGWEHRFMTDIIMNADPVVDEVGGAIWVSRWEFDMGTRLASIVPYKHDLTTSAVLNGVVNGIPAVLLAQQYPRNELSEPIIPEGLFSPNGELFSLPVLSYDPDGQIRTTVVSCSTTGGLCEGSARRWTSPTFFGLLRLIVPFSNNNIYAVVGPYQVYFLTAQLGTIMNLGEVPITPTGSLQVVGLQPGAGSDFYVLAGPAFGAGAASYPTEIIAVDSPQTGELWRLDYGTGESPLNGMNIGIDGNAQVWLRVGTDLVKPKPNSEYRSDRGPTPVP